jgi:hypothetical protein
MEYLITYSNYFIIEGKTFSFRKKQLFDITDIPKLIQLKNNNNCLGYWINRKWYSLSKLRDLVIKGKMIVDVSDLQWYEQINLDKVICN